MNDVGVMSNEIWFDLDEPVTPTTASISGWLVTNTAKLNIEIDGCYSVDASGNYAPPFCPQVSGVYKQMYIIKNLESRIRKGLDGSMYVTSGQSASMNWTKIEEGDSKITRASPAEMLKVLKSEKDSAKDDLENLIYTYRMNKSKALQVSGEDDLYPQHGWGTSFGPDRNGHQ